MYAYRKAMPTSNKRLDDKWQTKLRALHKQRLKHVKSGVDNKAPPKYLHLVQNLKKQQVDEERYSAIERENYLLLDKMSHIMTHAQTVDLRAPAPELKSLNKDHRKKELMRITEENQQILRRIQHKEPYYSSAMWYDDSVKQEAYLRNICEYPLLADSETKRSPRSKALDSSREEGHEVDQQVNALAAMSLGGQANAPMHHHVHEETTRDDEVEEAGDGDVVEDQEKEYADDFDN